MNINITIVGQAVSFVIFVLFCMKYIWIPMISVLEQRQKKISDVFASIEKSKKISEKDREIAIQYLEQAKIESQLIIKRAHQYKEQLLDQAKYEAQLEKNKILSQGYETIRIKKKCISEELQKEIGNMIILGIEKILECSVDNKSVIDCAIVEKVLNELSELSVCNIIKSREL